MKNKINIGDEVQFIPIKKGWLPVRGIVQDILNDERGYNIFTPLPDDPTRVLRVWLEDGAVVQLKAAEPPKESKIIKLNKKDLSKIKSITELADEIAAKGIDINNSYSEFVCARHLKPEINAKEWQVVYRQSLKLIN